MREKEEGKEERKENEDKKRRGGKMSTKKSPNMGIKPAAFCFSANVTIPLNHGPPLGGTIYLDYNYYIYRKSDLTVAPLAALAPPIT